MLQRNEVVQVLTQMGSHTGTRTVQQLFPQMARREVAELVGRYKDVCRRRQDRRWCQLHWRDPGTVWAIDHAHPPQPIDGRFESVLAVRDLASHYQLAWQPVLDASAATAVAALRSLLHRHGPPLVIKSDNGSAFTAELFQDLLCEHGVTQLLSPPALPRYNGSVESGIGSMKLRTADQSAFSDGSIWSPDDCEAARLIANASPRRLPGVPGAVSLSPAERWAARSPITQPQRQNFFDTLENQRGELRQQSVASRDAHAAARIERQSVSRTLVACGILLVTRRRITQPVPSEKAARIS